MFFDQNWVKGKDGIEFSTFFGNFPTVDLGRQQASQGKKEGVIGQHFLHASFR